MITAGGEAHRQWVRSLEDGQRGWLVERDGRKFVKLDRPQQDLLRPYYPNQWQAESEERKLSPQQVARIAYDADRTLRLATGTSPSVVKEWISLRDEDRIDFIDNGPPAEGKRRKLYEAILAVFGPEGAR